jgi:rhodanese-related sulfurtransferase
MDNKLILVIAVVAVITIITVLKHLGLAKPDELKDILAGKKYKFIDVRTVREFKGGAVKGARNIPVNELSQRIGKAVPNKATPILLYCHSGSRSGHAKKILVAKGYKNVFNLGSMHRAKEIMKK